MSVWVICKDSEFAYVCESVSESSTSNKINQSDYTYAYTYEDCDKDQWTNEYTYTYEEPSADQINQCENQKINKMNQALKTRSLLLDKPSNNDSPNNIINSTQSPNFSISSQPPIFIQRTPKNISKNKINQQRRKTPQKQTRNSEIPKKLSPRKKLVLHKINLLEEQLKYLQSSTSIADDFSSTELTESETKEDPKIRSLQQKLSQITGKNIHNPSDSYSPGNDQYTYTYAYEDSPEEEEINNYSIPKSRPKPKSTMKTTPKKQNQISHKKNLNHSSPKDRSLNRPAQNEQNINSPKQNERNSAQQTPKTPNLVLQTFNDEAISIENKIDISADSPQALKLDQRNKADLQISTSIRSEKVLEHDQKKKVLSNSVALESIQNDNNVTELKERSAKLTKENKNKKQEKTIKKIYRRFKVSKKNSKHSNKNDADFTVNPSITRNSPKKARSLLKVSDDDALNESEFAALNPVDARKYTNTYSIDARKQGKDESNDLVKIKIVEDANVPDVDRFCVFYIEGDEDSTKRTKTIHKGQNKFDENFEFPLNELFSSKLVIFLKKQDLIKEDRLLGTAKIDLQKVPQNSTLSKWIALKSDSGVRIQSKVHLVLKRETKILESDEVFADVKEKDVNSDHTHRRNKRRDHRRRRVSHHSEPEPESNGFETEKSENNLVEDENIEDNEKNSVEDENIEDNENNESSEIVIEKVEVEAQVDLLSEPSSDQKYEEEEEELRESENEDDDTYISNDEENSYKSREKEISQPPNLKERSNNPRDRAIEQPPESEEKLYHSKHESSNYDDEYSQSPKSEENSSKYEEDIPSVELSQPPNSKEYSLSSEGIDEINDSIHLGDISYTPKHDNKLNLEKNSYKSKHDNKSNLEENSYKSTHEGESKSFDISNISKSREILDLDNKSKGSMNSYETSSHESNTESFLLNSDKFEDAKIIAVKQANRLHSSATFDSVISESNNLQEEEEEPNEEFNGPKTYAKSNSTSHYSSSENSIKSPKQNPAIQENKSNESENNNLYLPSDASSLSSTDSGSIPANDYLLNKNINAFFLSDQNVSTDDFADFNKATKRNAKASNKQSDYSNKNESGTDKASLNSSRDESESDNKSSRKHNNKTAKEKGAKIQSNKSSTFNKKLEIELMSQSDNDNQSSSKTEPDLSSSQTQSQRLSQEPSRTSSRTQSRTPSRSSSRIEDNSNGSFDDSENHSKSNNGNRNRTSENDTESERIDDSFTSGSDSFNMLVVGELAKVDKNYNFNSSSLDISNMDSTKKQSSKTKSSRASRQSRGMSQSITNSESSNNNKLYDSMELMEGSNYLNSSNRKKNSKKDKILNASNSSSNSANNSVKLSDSDDLNQSNLSKSLRAPRNTPASQDLSNTEDDSDNLKNSSLILNNSFVSDDSLASSSSKKKRNSKSKRNDNDNSLSLLNNTDSKRFIYYTNEDSSFAKKNHK